LCSRAEKLTDVGTDEPAGYLLSAKRFLIRIVRLTYYSQMTKPSKRQIDTLRVGIDTLMRRFKIAEAGSADERGHKLNPIDIQVLLFIADHPGCTARAVGQHLA
jgi:hypothetical protein